MKNVNNGLKANYKLNFNHNFNYKLVPVLLGGLMGSSCSGESNTLEVRLKVTDAQGVADYDPPVIVKDTNQPVPGILVYQITGENDSSLTLPVNPFGRHFPRQVENRALSNQYGEQKSGLAAELIIFLET